MDHIRLYTAHAVFVLRGAKNLWNEDFWAINIALLSRNSTPQNVNHPRLIPPAGIIGGLVCRLVRSSSLFAIAET
jgi:hypothetical protein